MNQYISIWPYSWSFLEGTPAGCWQTKRHKDSRPFILDACLNLDSLCRRKPVPNESEGVLYAEFTTEQSCTALLGIGCNWCFEAYCDGQLIKSTYDTGNGSTYIFAVNNRIFFQVKEGQHLLAIKVRRGKDNWNFACHGVSPIVPDEPELSYGPWLTNPDVGRMTVAFYCKNPLGAAVQYRKIGEETWQTTWDHRQGQCLRRTYHAIALTGLEPGATYEYRIIIIHPDSFNEVQLGGLHTLTVPDACQNTFSFFFTADLQYPPEQQHEILGKMLAAAQARDCDFLVLDGDMNNVFLPENIISGPFAQLCEFGADSKPIIYLRGNHEMRGDNGDRFLDFFATNLGTTYDITRFGDTAFLLLDSWEDKPAKTPGHSYCQWNLDEWFYNTEKNWLKSALSDEKWTGAKRRIVICHGAPYSHFDACQTIPYVLADLTDPYFGGLHPVSPLNLWLAGHVHRYLRSLPGTKDLVAESLPPVPAKDGTTYTYPVLTVAGPGQLKSIASCFRIDATPDGFRIRSWDHNGSLMEDFRYDNDGTLTESVSLTHYAMP